MQPIVMTLRARYAAWSHRARGMAAARSRMPSDDDVIAPGSAPGRRAVSNVCLLQLMSLSKPAPGVRQPQLPDCKLRNCARPGLSDSIRFHDEPSCPICVADRTGVPCRNAFRPGRGVRQVVRQCDILKLDPA